MLRARPPSHPAPALVRRRPEYWLGGDDGEGSRPGPDAGIPQGRDGVLYLVFASLTLAGWMISRSETNAITLQLPPPLLLAVVLQVDDVVELVDALLDAVHQPTKRIW